MTNLNYQQTHFVMSAPDIRHLPSDTGIEVAFAGRSNAGKSSALNTLTNQKSLARTSKTPGRTQLINLFEVADGQRLVDLPGYGYAKAPEKLVKQWQVVLKTYLRGRPTLRRVFLLIDSRHGLKKEDREIMKLLDESAVTYQVVLTKIDKISEKALSAVSLAIIEELKKHAAAMPEPLATSSEKKIGLDVLKAEVCSFMK